MTMTSPHVFRRRMAATTPLVLALLLLAFVLAALSLGDRAIARMAAGLAMIALAASLTPALAGGSGCHHDQQASMSCAEGPTWDAATKTCIKLQS